jgi:hypothetical protein
MSDRNLPLFVPSSNYPDVTITYPNSDNIDASLVNYGQLLQQSNTITPWLDTKLFPVIQVTASLAVDACAHIFWGIGDEDEVPNNYALCQDTIRPGIQRTTEWDSRARWARIFLAGTNPGELSYVLKPTPTGVKIVDDSGSIVSVTSNAMQIVYRDSSGILGTTDSGASNEGNALYTSITTSDGTPIGKYLDTLNVAVRDDNGANLSVTSLSGDTLMVGGTFDRQTMDVVFFMDLSAAVFNTDSVLLSVGTYTISGSYNAPTLTVDTVSLNSIESSVSALKPGYLFGNDTYRYISAIDGLDITISGNDTVTLQNNGTAGQYDISAETYVGHLIHNDVFTTVDHITSTYGWDNSMRVAFVGSDLCVNYTTDPTTFKARLDGSMVVMLQGGVPNNLHGALNAFGTDAYFSHQPDRLRHALVLVYHNIDDNVALDTSFSRISATQLGTPTGVSSLTAGQTSVATTYIIDSSVGTSSRVLDIVFGDLYTGSNALAIVPTDVCAHTQASTLSDVCGAFGKVALYYALADTCGTQIGTTNSGVDSNNSLYVTITDASGLAYNSSRPVPITIGSDVITGLMMDNSLGDVMTHLIDINDTELSGNAVNLNSINLSNETAVPVWFKLYDTHEGLAIYAEQTNDYTSAQDTLKINIAVPPLSTRDVRLEKGMLFNHGLCARVSTQHGYDVSTTGNLTTDTQTFIATSHSKVSLTPAQQTANIAARPEPNVDDIRKFQINRSGVTLRGFVNSIRNSSQQVTKVLFVPLEATGIAGTHNAITLSLNDLAGDPITLSNTSSYGSTLYNTPMLPGEPKLLELATPVDISGYTVIVNLNNSTDASWAHIDTIGFTDLDSCITSFTRYGDDGVLTAYVDRLTDNLTVYPMKINGGLDTDISQMDFFSPGTIPSGQLSNSLGTIEHSSTVHRPSGLPKIGTYYDFSSYLITYDASVYIVDSGILTSNQYTYKTEVNDASTNRINYFGISLDHLDGSNWCFSTPQFVGYVHNNDNDLWRTSIARFDKDFFGTQYDVSYYQNGTGMGAVTVSGVVTHSNNFKVSYWDSSATNYNNINRFIVRYGLTYWDFSLENLGGGTKFIYLTASASEIGGA